MKKEPVHEKRERPFIMVDHAVVMSGKLSAYDLAVYVVLCAYADHRNGTWFPSYQTIAEHAGCSRRKAVAVISHLEELGLIRKENQYNRAGDNTSNLYTVIAAPDLHPDVRQTPPSTSCSLPDAEDTPYPDSINQNQDNQIPMIFNSEEEQLTLPLVQPSTIELEQPSHLDNCSGLIYSENTNAEN